MLEQPSDSDSDDGGAVIFIEPPLEPPTAASDEDSDHSDEEAAGDVLHLPARILQAPAHMTVDLESDWDTEDEIPLAHFAKTNLPRYKPGKDWTEKNPAFIIPGPQQKIQPSKDDFLRETLKTPIDAFRIFLSEKFIEEMCRQTQIYAGQKGDHNFNIGLDEFLTFVGILIFSGYHKLSSKRDYWSNEEDLHCPLVADSMRRNRFEDILRFLHCADNSKMKGQDSMYKVRPIFQFMNEAFKATDLPNNLCVDETILPYFGHHGAKQFIRGKPVRYGFKLWCIGDATGYIYHAEPYCGKSTRVVDRGLGQGPNVVLSLLDQCSPSPGTKIYFDNLFTSTSLLMELSKRQLGGTGTMRENRVHPCMQLPEKKKFAKEPRGTWVTRSEGDLLIVRWQDNAPVTVLSNCDALEPLKTTSRYSRAQKKNITVPMPSLISSYNKEMGGIDLNDQFQAQYRTGIRIKKWWWPFFRWAIDEAVVQGWLLFRRCGHDFTLKQFRRQVAVSLLKMFGEPKRSSGPRASTSLQSAAMCIAKDNKGHLIVKGEKKYARCRVCQRRTIYICCKCNVSLHPECFLTYHT